MNRVIAWVKNIRPLKILTVLVAGFFLFFTQACSPGSATQPPGTPKLPPNANDTGPNSELYVPKGADVINPVERGMNNFSDVDPRSKEAKTEVKAKTEALKQNAEQNVIDQTGTLGENTRRTLDKKGENAADFGKNLQQNTEGTKDKTDNSTGNFLQGVKRGIENIKENTSNAAEDLTKGAQRAGDDAKTNVQRTAEDAGKAVNRTVREAD